jgi:DNA mismatch repair protein PMS2
VGNIFQLCATLIRRKSTLQLSTNGNKTIRENITNVFGAKILTSLESLSMKVDIDVRHIGGKRTTESIEVVGYVSKSAHGEGRSSSDRQFFYVNSRPCIQPKVLSSLRDMIDCRLQERSMKSIGHIIVTSILLFWSILDLLLVFCLI